METYNAQGWCTNCGRENYPQWGVYEVGTKVTDQPCPNCKLMTWVLDLRDHSKGQLDSAPSRCSCDGITSRCSKCPDKVTP